MRSAWARHADGRNLRSNPRPEAPPRSYDLARSLVCPTFRDDRCSDIDHEWAPLGSAAKVATADSTHPKTMQSPALAFGYAPNLLRSVAEDNPLEHLWTSFCESAGKIRPCVIKRAPILADICQLGSTSAQSWSKLCLTWSTSFRLGRNLPADL